MRVYSYVRHDVQLMSCGGCGLRGGLGIVVSFSGEKCAVL